MYVSVFGRMLSEKFLRIKFERVKRSQVVTEFDFVPLLQKLYNSCGSDY